MFQRVVRDTVTKVNTPLDVIDFSTDILNAIVLPLFSPNINTAFIAQFNFCLIRKYKFLPLT